MTTDLARIPLVDSLTPRQRAFVTHPLAITDPEMAAIQSGYDAKYAKKYGEALRKELWYFIQHGEAAQMVRRAVTPQSVIDELNNLAFSNALDFFEVIDSLNETGQVIGSMLVPKQNLKAMPPDMQRLIKRVKFDTIVSGDGTAMVFVADIELHGKEWALKEIIEMLRLKQTGAPKDETADLLEYMDAKDLESMEGIFERAANNKRNQLTKDKK